MGIMSKFDKIEKKLLEEQNKAVLENREIMLKEIKRLEVIMNDSIKKFVKEEVEKQLRDRSLTMQDKIFNKE